MGAAPREIHVRLPGRPTRVLVGAGLGAALADPVRAAHPRARRCALVVDDGVAAHHEVRCAWEGVDVLRLPVAGGEPAKSREGLARLQDELLALRRGEPVVVVGGGAVLDVAGFAAATVRRGLPWVAVPTTVLAMADASVGGKVAINHARGKNLLGTFHPPGLVLTDPRYLASLPEAERRAGLAEVYKVARLGDAALLARLREGPPDSEAAWQAAIAAAVAFKAALVEQDERDTGVRRALNLGHGVGHALERLRPDGAIRHGEAVAIGMVVAARLAEARGRLASAEADAYGRDLARLGLPTTVPGDLDAEALLEALAEDKKRREHQAHTFVLPTGATGWTIVEDVVDEEVRAAIAGVRG